MVHFIMWYELRARGAHLRGRTTRWSTKVSVGLIPGCHVAKRAPPCSLKLMARCEMTFEEGVALHRVDRA